MGATSVPCLASVLEGKIPNVGKPSGTGRCYRCCVHSGNKCALPCTGALSLEEAAWVLVPLCSPAVTFHVMHQACRVTGGASVWGQYVHC